MTRGVDCPKQADNRLVFTVPHKSFTQNVVASCLPLVNLRSIFSKPKATTRRSQGLGTWITGKCLFLKIKRTFSRVSSVSESIFRMKLLSVMAKMCFPITMKLIKQLSVSSGKDRYVLSL